MSGLLAIDQATVTGWAWCEPGGVPPEGLAWGHKRMEGATHGEMYGELRLLLSILITRYGPRCLVYEAPWVPRPDRTKDAMPLNPQVLRLGFGWVAHITEIAHGHGIGCAEVQSSRVAKFITGKGRFSGDQQVRRQSKKAAVVAACKARGWQCTHDEADAIAMLMYQEYQLYPRESIARGMKLKLPQGPLFA